jgi:hypothetical protein
VPPEPTGNLVLDQETLAYGDTASFTVTTADVPKQAEVYVTVVCKQADRVVYQSSVEPFVLVDQPGQGLEWDGAAASGVARLTAREERGKKAILHTLDEIAFEVSGG